VASVLLVGISVPLTPIEIEGLVRTAAVHGDPDDLSSWQHELAACHYALLQADIDVQPQDATS
jgi:hypothetical protein